jgi:hypothetical protein
MAIEFRHRAGRSFSVKDGQEWSNNNKLAVRRRGLRYHSVEGVLDKLTPNDRQIELKTTIFARAALGLPLFERWHTIGVLLPKIEAYQKVHGLLTRVKSEKSNTLYIAGAITASIGIASTLVTLFPGEFHVDIPKAIGLAVSSTLLVGGLALTQVNRRYLYDVKSENLYRYLDVLTRYLDVLTGQAPETA